MRGSMSSSAEEQRVKEVAVGGRVYRWDGDLHEWSAMTTVDGQATTLHALISQTNGDVLDALAEAGW